jgi:hypothetical protein
MNFILLFSIQKNVLRQVSALVDVRKGEDMTWQDFGAALGIVLGIVEAIKLLYAFRAKVKIKVKEMVQRKRQERLNKKR